MSADERWLATQWPKVRSYLPASPARVVEIGCGSLGGFVPALQDSGYQALGIDPKAPEGDGYVRMEVEHAVLPAPIDAAVACTSLHHVVDPGEVVDKIADALAPGGVVIVVEWDWESFDEATAQWCFQRLGASEGWLHHRRNEWIASAQTWQDYLATWAAGHGLHTGQALLAQLDRRLRRQAFRRGAYFFPDLAGTTEAEELEAINSGQIRATRVDYVGALP